MSTPLPERASLEHLKKEAKSRLRALRKTNSNIKLAAAQLFVARKYGFTSWRALKAEVEKGREKLSDQFLEACANGNIELLRSLLASDPALARRTSPGAQFEGWTGLHEAAKHGQAKAVRLLLSHGADPNARETGDNTCPLHWAAAHRHIDVVRLLLDAGADVHGHGDLHALDVIGWATYFRDAEAPLGHKPEVAALLVEHGAKHHVFSAMSLGDLDMLRELAERDPAALDRRMSRFEDQQTCLHLAINIGRMDLLSLLVKLGAKLRAAFLEAKDKNGLTPLELALMRGNQDAVALLTAAGAKRPKRGSTRSTETLARLAGSVTGQSPMIYVPDVAAALDWYVALGFKEVSRYQDKDVVNFGVVKLGAADILINMHGRRGEQTASLWIRTSRVDEMYARLKSRQIASAMAGGSGDIDFVEHLNDTFYGARQFGIRDLNGYILYFIQSNVRSS